MASPVVGRLRYANAILPPLPISVQEVVLKWQADEAGCQVDVDSDPVVSAGVQTVEQPFPTSVVSHAPKRSAPIVGRG